MEEVACPRCGAVFFLSAATLLCPHCSLNVGSRWERMLAQARHNVWQVVAGLVIGLATWPAHMGLWLFWGMVGLGLVVWVCSTAFETWGWDIRSHLTTLDLSSKEAKKPKGEYVPRVPPPPKVPAEWQPLIALPRPREVYMPIGATLTLIGGITGLLAVVGVLGYAAWKHHRVLPSQWLEHGDWLIFATLGAWVSYAVYMMRNELPGRALLSDGEVTIGIVKEAKGGTEAKTAVYRFWTSTGQRFENRGLMISGRSTYAQGSLVPVFYSPQDPTKSVALCCVASRIRTAEERMQRQMRRTQA